MKFDFRIIPHRHQRYSTVGDYVYRKGRWVFTISRLGDRRYEQLVFLHELIEWAVSRLQGVKNRDIDRFDRAYERRRGAARAPCGCEPYDEPGDDPHAPYREAHQVATTCERLIARALGVDWEHYAETVESL